MSQAVNPDCEHLLGDMRSLRLGRQFGLRYLEWRWDPDPADSTYLVHYAFLLRSADGEVRVTRDRHEEGLFSRTEWLRWFAEAGLSLVSALDSSGREFFLGTPRAAA